VAFMIVMGVPFSDRFSLVGTTIVLAVAVFLFGLVFVTFFGCRISREGLEASFVPFTDLIRWEEVRKVWPLSPFAFYLVEGTPSSIFFLTCVFVPRPWLQKDPKAFREAIERHAPAGHVMRRVFLGNEKSILRDALKLVLFVAAYALLLTYLYYAGHDPLHDAVSAGRTQEVRELIRAGPELVNERDRFGRTPLHWAAQEGHAEIAEYLIAEGARIDVKDKPPLGCTPLHVAVGCGQETVVRVLLDDGASLDVRDEQGRTPLDTAIQNGREEIAEMLRQHGARQE